jgi:hypothetical protein
LRLPYKKPVHKYQQINTISKIASGIKSVVIKNYKNSLSVCFG